MYSVLRSYKKMKKIVALYDKCCSSINRVSVIRNDSINVVPGKKVHIHCRKRYAHPRQKQ